MQSNLRDAATDAVEAGGDMGVTGVFRSLSAMNGAVRRLTAKSVPANSIRVFVVGKEGTRLREVEVEDEAGALRGALIGAGAGAAVGLALVLLVPTGLLGTTSVDLLGLTGFSGAFRTIVLGALVGVPLGTILGMGRWDGRKKISEQEIAQGEVHVVVESDELATLARGVLEDAGAERTF